MTKQSHRVGGSCSALALLLGLGGCSGHEETAALDAALAHAPQLVATIGDETIAYRQRQPLSVIGTTPIALANGRRLRVDRAAERALARHRQLSGELAGVGAALLLPATTSEEFIETEHTAILLATTKLTVKDPALLRGGAPLVGKFRMKGPGALRLELMSPQQRDAFARFKARMLGQPKTHPLGFAARQGDQALLDAVLSGKGDLVITTKVEVPLDALTLTGGRYRQPSFAGGSFNYAAAQSQQIPGFGSGLPTFGDEEHEGVELEVGVAANATQFVNGFTEADAYEWSERWDFGIGHVEVEVGASYGLGLRIPIKVTSSMDPINLQQLGGSRNDASSFDTDLSVEVLDADEDFYEKAGLPEDEIQDGKELVLNAEAHLSIEVDLLGVAEVDVSDGVEVDFGRDFKPPFGDCGTACGLEFWLPADLTRTEIDAGVAGASAQLGFNLSGDGEVVLGYRSLYDGQTAPSAMGAGATWSTHDVSFTHERERHFHTSLAALPEPGSKTFGYEISDVEYTWDVAVTPGIKGDVWVDALVLNWAQDLPEQWLGFAEVELGSVPFGPHAGSRASRSIVRGEKSWSELGYLPAQLGDGAMAADEVIHYAP